MAIPRNVRCVGPRDAIDELEGDELAIALHEARGMRLKRLKWLIRSLRGYGVDV